MGDLRRRIASQMAALIKGPAFGCNASAAAAIYAATGQSVSEGTLTKRKQGTCGWPIDEVAALEDASGIYSVTKLLNRRIDADDDQASGSMLMYAGAISKETGEAVNAILRLLDSECPNDDAQALVEIDEAIDVLRKARARVEAKQIPTINQGTEFKARA